MRRRCTCTTMMLSLVLSSLLLSLSPSLMIQCRAKEQLRCFLYESTIDYRHSQFTMHRTRIGKFASSTKKKGDLSVVCRFSLRSAELSLELNCLDK
ncbi:MAG: hypothetical protein J3R72DRAFT_239078 [Linnemannia gamsii]|nr:MAG: hypothetical protein J3R72DRAFT_239078 [Linnemannia gamsii]